MSPIDKFLPTPGRRKFTIAALLGLSILVCASILRVWSEHLSGPEWIEAIKVVGALGGGYFIADVVEKFKKNGQPNGGG